MFLFSVLRELNVGYLDMVILALPTSLLKNDERDVSTRLEELKVYWRVLEDLVHEGLMLSIGFSDLDSLLLEALYKWSEV